MPKPKAKPVTENVTKEDLTLKVVEHITLGDNIKNLTKQKTTATDFIKKHIAEHGEKTETGSVIFTSKMSGQLFRAENRAVNTVTLVPQAQELLEDAGLGHYVSRRKVEVIEVDEEALKADVKAGAVDAALVQKLYVVKTSFSLYTDIVKGAEETDDSEG